MIQKNDYKPFRCGTVFNPCHNVRQKLGNRYKSVSLLYPSRLNAMALDPSKVTKNDNMQYSAGEIVFKIKQYKKVTVERILRSDKIEITNTTHRSSLVLHAALIMRAALGYNCGLRIDVENQSEIKHAGLGSSSSLIAAVAAGVNELFERPISKPNLLQYVAQNHGEEIAGDDKMLSPVQCIGGSAAGGLYSGGMLILSGKNRVVASMNISDKYLVVLGIPKDFSPLDANSMLQKEIRVFPSVMACGVKYGPTVAYRMLHEVLPSLIDNNLQAVGNLIYDYRFKMGSIDFCSYTYPKMRKIAKQLSYLKTEGYAEVLSISSVGPAFFAITTRSDVCEDAFRKAGLEVITSSIENRGYQLLEKICYEQ